jgi:hypothetical protein
MHLLMYQKFVMNRDSTTRKCKLNFEVSRRGRFTCIFQEIELLYPFQFSGVFLITSPAQIVRHFKVQTPVQTIFQLFN